MAADTIDPTAVRRPEPSGYVYSTVFGYSVRRIAGDVWGVFAPGDDPRKEPMARSTWLWPAMLYAAAQRPPGRLGP